jgi:hypothetical protein
MDLGVIFLYVEIWPMTPPPGQYILRQRGSFFSCRKPNQTINSTVLRRKVTPVEYWPGVKFLRRILTPGSLFYGSIYLQPTRRKVTPVEYWPGGSHFYVEKWPRVNILRGHFSTTYAEKNYPKVMNSTEKGVTFLRRILTGGHISM